MCRVPRLVVLRAFLFIGLPLLSAALLSGCATTAPATYRTRATAAEKVPKLHVVIAPLDAELAQLTAGGLEERRDDWTEQATANLNAALAAETGWTLNSSLTPDQQGRLQAETDDVQALLRAITLNHLLTAGPVPQPNGFPAPKGPLTYHTGRLDQHIAVLGNDGAVLFVFVRDSYATGGRKALFALGMLTGIVPMLGVDVMSAALVEHDGSVLWFNVQLNGADPRTAEGARDVARKLLAGLPPRTT